MLTARQFLDSRSSTPIPFSPKRSGAADLSDSIESLRVNGSPADGPDANGHVNASEDQSYPGVDKIKMGA